MADAIKFGEVIFIAVPYGALPEIGREYGAALKGKIVLDAGNAVQSRDGDIAKEAERDGVGATSQKYLPGAHLVRAFNTMSYTIFAREANRPEPRMNLSEKSRISSSTVSIRFGQSSPASSIFCLPIAPQRGCTVGSSTVVAHE